MPDFPIYDLDPLDAFPSLCEIPDPPKTLHIRGSLDRIAGTKLVTVVGSRNYTPYGKHVCELLIKGLAQYPVTIVSGLAIGIDSIAHKAALEVGLPTIAFPGSGLNWSVLHPAQHRALAESIPTSGGALLSEFAHDTRGAIWTFPRRNRIKAGISDMVIIIEAEEKSGTLITARLGTEYNRIVGAVPGPITSDNSKGTNWLIRLGATPITCVEDIVQELGLAPKLTSDVSSYLLLNSDEERVVAILSEPKSRDEIMEELDLDPVAANIIFSTLEIKGVISESMGRIQRLV